ncbi:extracellular solute-binding protein [Saccharibacillus deserti]|uniref:extracellular solute-binding protein n=1 Tax=Saccharibacillus deserti TaxID=1634444 RepID=UPI001553DD00|nr:extracellular solute-binding protein [Saccharibacillus deserti]
MKRKNHFVLFGILLLALINLSPSLPETSTSRSQPDGESAALRGGKSEQPLREIEVYTMMGTEEFKALQAVNEEYQRKAGTLVTLVNIAPEQAYKTYRTAYASGREPDVLMLDGSWVADLASEGRLLPADLYETGVTSAADSLPLPAASVEWNGYRWAVPLDLDPYGAVWSPERFTGESGKLPADDKSWQSWEKGLSEEKASPGGISGPQPILGLPSGDVRAFAALLALWESALQGEEGPRIEHALQRAEALRGRTYLNDASATEGHPPSELRAKVESGELDLAVDRLSRLGAEDSPESRVVPLTSAAHTAVLRCFGISANTEHAREASLWIAYLTGHEAQSGWHAATGRLPVLRSVYDGSASAELLRWMPNPAAERSAGAEAGAANPKKAPAREIAWSRSLDRFYEGKLGAGQLAVYLRP